MHLEENKSKNNYLNKKDQLIKEKLMLCILELINSYTLETLIVILIFLWVRVIKKSCTATFLDLTINNHQSSFSKTMNKFRL